MVRSKIKRILFFICALLMLTCLTSSCLLLRYLPDNEYSIELFKIVYKLPVGRKSFLEFYSPARENVRGYVPVEVNQFLIQKLEVTKNENEFSAIVNFYALQASDHRLGYLLQISEQAKIKVIKQIIKDLDDEATFVGKIMMLEELRIGKSLGKGGYFIEKTNYPQFATWKEHQKWFYGQSASVVIPKYKEWWNSNLSWEEKRKINPLQETNVRVSECCG